jgi:hypothetical protein
MYNRSGALSALIALSVCSAAAAQVPDPHAECRERLAKFEERLRMVEAALKLDAPKPEPSAAPMTPPRRLPFEMPPELVPEIGKIGSQVGLLLAQSSNPFQLNSGSFVGGFIDLPLFEAPRRIPGKISYEVMIGISQSRTTFPTTSNVAQVANLAVLTALNPNGGLQNVTAAVSGTGAAPFPVTLANQTRLRLLQVVPFSFKYTSTAFDRWRIRPYGILGFGTFVTIHNQNPGRGAPPNYGIRPDAALPPDISAAVKQIFGGQAPFGGPLVAGQIAQSPEIERRGLPGGNGNIDLGVHSGAGFEIRLSRGFSFGFDTRYNRIAGTNGRFQTYGSRLGFHF